MISSADSNPLTTVDDVLITTELANRPRRAPDHEIESQALGLLAQEMAGNPRNVLQKCAELVMKLCHADSAGISVLEPGGTDDMLRWQAAAGAFAPNLNGTMLREASPCGTVMERDRVLLFNEAERFFPALQGVEPSIYENLLAPWHVKGKAVGTLWAIKHTAEGRFDAEDARILQSLGRFAAAAFQTISALDEAIAERSAVHELEKRQSFLLELSDALRPVSEAREVQAITTRLVGAHLGADRVMYAEVEGKPGAETGTIHAQFVRQAADGDAPVARFPDHFTFDPFGAHTMAARYRGEPLVVRDVASDPAFRAAERAAWQKVGVCAAIVAPLSKGGRLVAEFGVHSVGPRDWTTEDVTLVQEVAERTWAAAERARAEDALRWSEEKYRTVFESMDEGFLVHEMIRNEAGKVVDYRLLEANPAHQRATGLPPETIGKLGSEFMPEVESHWLELFHRVSTSGVTERSEMYNAPTSRWYNVQVSPVRDHDRIAVVFDDVTTRKQAETQLRESEQRQIFLLKLADTVRPLVDPADIQGETTRLLREQLNAAWCYYVDWDLFRNVGRVLRDSVGEGIPSLAGAHDVSDAAEFLELLASEKLLTVRDYAGYEQLPTRIRQQFTALGFRSMMAAPLVKKGHLIATLLVGDTEARDWSESDVSLLAEVAERTWAAIERARAESALRESEARLAYDLESTQVLQNISNKLISKPGVNGHFDEFCEAARVLMRSDCASIQAYDKATSRLKLVGHVGFHPDSAAFWEWVDAGVGSSCGRALSKGERVIVADMDLFDADPLDVEAYRRSAILSVQSTPLVARDGEVVGMMSTHWHQRNVPADASYRFFDILARLAADFIVRIRAEAALRESEERFQQFAKASASGIWIRDAETLNMEFVSPAIATIYGIDPDAILGDVNQWVSLIVPDDRKIAMRHLDEAVRGKTVVHEFRIRRPSDQSVRWIRNTDFPLYDEKGNVERVGGIAEDVTETKAAEELLAGSEERLRSAAEIARFALWDWNVESGHVTWSDEHFRMEGYEVGEVRPSYEAWIARVHPDDQDDTQAAIAVAWDTRNEYVHEFRTLHPDGSVHWLSARGRFFYDRAGNAVRMIGAMLDTTERREWEERQKILVAELQHRTRNLMGVVRSMAESTARSSKDFTDFRARYRDRLASLARVQGLLSRLDEHDRVTFDELIGTELTAIEAGSERVTTEGPAGVRLRSSTVQTLALAIHELATNASKYGALVQPNGRLQVRWTFEQAAPSAKPWLHIDWRETGLVMPPSDAPARGTGQGRELIEKALPYQLGAKTSYSFEADGVHCTISIPVSTTGKETEHA